MGKESSELVRSSPDGQDIERADCEEQGERSEDGRVSGSEINSRIPLAESEQHGSSAETELIILRDVQGDHTTTLHLNNNQHGYYEPEKLEDLYQDITKNVLKKIVK